MNCFEPTPAECRLWAASGPELHCSPLWPTKPADRGNNPRKAGGRPVRAMSRPKISMNQTRFAVPFRVATCRHKGISILPALVRSRVAFGREKDCFRHARQVRRVQGKGRSILDGRSPSKADVFVKLTILPGQHRRVGMIEVAAAGPGCSEYAMDKDLAGDGYRPATQRLRDASSHGCTCPDTDYGKRSAIEVPRLAGDQKGIFICGRMHMFWRQPIPDADDTKPGLPTDINTEVVVTVQTAPDEPAAVQVNDRRARRDRQVDTYRNRTEHSVHDGQARRPWGTKVSHHLIVEPTLRCKASVGRIWWKVPLGPHCEGPRLRIQSIVVPRQC